jgi:drug/metabolite transporter (DMT)-like permease
VSGRESVPPPAARAPRRPPAVDRLGEEGDKPSSPAAPGRFSPPARWRLSAGEASRRGAAFAIAAGVAYGTLGIFGTLFYDEGGTSFTLLVMRFCGAAVVLVAIALLRRRPAPTRRDALVSALCGFGQLGATFCLFAGFEDASPGIVVLLFYVYPLLVTLGDRAFFGVTLGSRRGVLLGLGIAGIALTVGIPDSATASGILWGLGAGVFTSMFILGSRHVMSQSVDSFQFVALAFGAAAIALLVVVAVVGMDSPPAPALPWATCLIAFSSVLPMLLFYSAIHLAGAGTAARLATVEPVTAVVLSFLVLGDTLSASQIAGGAIVVLSVALLAGSPAARRAAPALQPDSP